MFPQPDNKVESTVFGVENDGLNNTRYSELYEESDDYDGSNDITLDDDDNNIDQRDGSDGGDSASESEGIFYAFALVL